MPFIDESEKLSFLKSSKVFAAPFAYYSVKFRTNMGEKELCDCLLVYQGISVIVQVKRRDSSGVVSSGVWFKRRVRGEAVDQVVTAVEHVRHGDSLFFYADDGNEVVIDSKTKLVPVIIFDNPEIKDYPRSFFCHRLNKSIDVFELRDFAEALDTLLIPSEVLEYLEFRRSLCAGNKNIFKFSSIISESRDSIMFLDGGVKTEKELAELYYAFVYNDKCISPDKLNEFNRIVKLIYSSFLDSNSAKRISALFNAVKVKEACVVVDYWYETLRRSQETALQNPFVLSLETDAAFFIPVPRNADFFMFREQTLNRLTSKYTQSPYKTLYPIFIAMCDDGSFRVYPCEISFS